MTRLAVQILIGAALAGTLRSAPAGPSSNLARRLGFYQWDGVGVEGSADDLLTQARRHASATGSRVFRLYLGARYDYRHHAYSPRSFAGDGLSAPPTPARILELPRYRAVLEDPGLETVILTTYTTFDYGAGPDNLNLLRPWTPAAEATERTQIRELCDFLYARFAALSKTVVIANSEADELLLGIMNYSGSPDRAIGNLASWTRARHEAVGQARAAHPGARLQVLHGFEISLVNLRIARQGPLFRKSPAGSWNALGDVVPRAPFDILLYSAYESLNSPFETGNIDVDPAQIRARLRRDLDRIRDAARRSLSPLGRRLYGARFVAVGEIGFARDRFDRLPTGGVAPRLLAALETAATWGCPYIILWQVLDAPRAGREPYGFGMIDRKGQAPKLQPAPNGCSSLGECLAGFLGAR